MRNCRLTCSPLLCLAASASAQTEGRRGAPPAATDKPADRAACATVASGIGSDADRAAGPGAWRLIFNWIAEQRASRRLVAASARARRSPAARSGFAADGEPAGRPRAGQSRAGGGSRRRDSTAREGEGRRRGVLRRRGAAAARRPEVRPDPLRESRHRRPATRCDRRELARTRWPAGCPKS